MSTYDETVVGGRYLVGGVLVDAEGREIKGTAAPADTDPLAAFPELDGMTVDQVRATSDDDLLKLAGIGPAKLAKIREAVA